MIELNSIDNLYIGSTQGDSIYLGDTKIWPQVTPVVTYTPLEYIESLAYAYFISDYYPVLDTKITLKFRRVNNGNGCPYWCEHDTANGVMFNFIALNENTATYWRFFNINQYANNYYTNNVNYGVTISKTGYADIDANGNERTRSWSASTTLDHYAYPLKIGGRGQDDYNNKDLIIYYIYVMEGNNYIHKYEPVRSSLGEVGFMDTVTNTFHVSTGSTDFIAGPDKA